MTFDVALCAAIIKQTNSNSSYILLYTFVLRRKQKASITRISSLLLSLLVLTYTFYKNLIVVLHHSDNAL